MRPNYETPSATTAQTFINCVLPMAINMQLAYGLPGAAVIAQSCDETGYGQYITCDMTTGANSYNLFNIQGTNGPAGYVTAESQEYLNGQWVLVKECFRAYHNYQESFNDYASMITTDARYAPAVTVETSPTAYIQEIYTCGYATDPNYVTTIDSIMTAYNLISEVEVVADNTPDSWAAAQWAECVEAGILDGTLPREALTREMLAVILVKLGLVKTS